MFIHHMNIHNILRVILIRKVINFIITIDYLKLYVHNKRYLISNLNCILNNFILTIFSCEWSIILTTLFSTTATLHLRDNIIVEVSVIIPVTLYCVPALLALVDCCEISSTLTFNLLYFHGFMFTYSPLVR